MTHPQGHLDLDALADVLAGERDDDHLRGCDACTDRLAELAAADADVTAALAALPAPPLPAGLSLRLTQTVRAERRREVAAVRTQRRRPPAWLPAVAASAVLVLAGATGWALLDLSGTGGQDTAASTAAGGGSGQDESATEAGAGDQAAQDTSRDEAATGPAAPGTAASSVPAPAPSPAPSPAGATAFAAPTAPTAATGTDWAVAAGRAAALGRLLRLSDPAGSTVARAVPAVAGLDRLRDPAALAACLAGLPGGDVLAVDFARYDGAPALAVVQPDGAARVRLTVVGSGCSAADPQVLRATVVARP